MASIWRRLKQFIRGRRADAATLRAKIDSAQTTAENRNHWRNADSLGPNAAYDAKTCQTLRERGRYEAVNNGFLKSLIKTGAYDLIGTCPRPEFRIPGDVDGTAAKAVERRFSSWCRANMLGQKLRVMAKACLREGDGYLILTDDPDSPDPVRLAVLDVEADQCQTPREMANDPKVKNGIRINDVGRPLRYYFLAEHPGESSDRTFRAIDSRWVLHWFEKDRGGQQIGIPQITPALPLYAQLRRLTLATLTAAEFAATIAGIMSTSNPADGDPPELPDWYMAELPRGTLMKTPAGHSVTQMKAEHPTTTYAEFERSKLNEAGRSIGAPLNVSTGNSSGYNFSSGRLDHLPYQRNHWVDRDDFEIIVVDPIIREWLAEAVLIAGHLPGGLPPISEWEWSINWDGFPEIDEQKASSTDDQRLRNGTTNFATIAAERFGMKWRDVIDQVAVEIAYCRSKGVRHPFEAVASPPNPASAAAAPSDTGDDDEAETPTEDSRIGFSRNGVHHG